MHTDTRYVGEHDMDMDILSYVGEHDMVMDILS